MITRFDHAVIAMPDLDAAMREYARAGFAVSRGGRHPGRGTQNAIIRFGLDYLELLALADEAEARASGWHDEELQAFTRGELLDFALASDDLAADAARLRMAGIDVAGPFEGSRRRPDGALLAWQTLTIVRAPSQAAAAATSGFAHHRGPWPFLIQWRTPEAERLAGDTTGPQPNGTTGVWGVSVIVRDLEAAAAVYERGLGLPLAERKTLDGMAAERARFVVGGAGTGGSRETRIDLLAPVGEGPVARALAAQGEGLYSVLLATPDLAATHTYLDHAGVGANMIPGRADELLIAPEATVGARLVIRAAR